MGVADVARICGVGLANQNANLVDDAVDRVELVIAASVRADVRGT